MLKLSQLVVFCALFSAVLHLNAQEFIPIGQFISADGALLDVYIKKYGNGKQNLFWKKLEGGYTFEAEFISEDTKTGTAFFRLRYAEAQVYAFDYGNEIIKVYREKPYTLKTTWRKANSFTGGNTFSSNSYATDTNEKEKQQKIQIYQNKINTETMRYNTAKSQYDRTGNQLYLTEMQTYQKNIEVWMREVTRLSKN